MLDLANTPAEELDAIIATEVTTLVMMFAGDIMPTEVIERMTPLLVCIVTSCIKGSPAMAMATCKDEMLSTLVLAINDFVTAALIENKQGKINNITLAQAYLTDYFSYGRDENVMAIKIGYDEDLGYSELPCAFYTDLQLKIIQFANKKGVPGFSFCEPINLPYVVIPCHPEKDLYSSFQVEKIITDAIQSVNIYQENYDADQDGIVAEIDNCPTIANPIDPTTGFQKDSDNDGYGDACDTQCPDTPEGEKPNENGCSLSQLFAPLKAPVGGGEIEPDVPASFSYNFVWDTIDHPYSPAFKYCISIKKDLDVDESVYEECPNDLYYEISTQYMLEPNTSYVWGVWAQNPNTGVWSLPSLGYFSTPPTPIEYEMVDIGMYLGGESNAIAVNAKGQVLGYYDINGECHAFVWDRVNGIQELGNLNGLDINDSGEVVGNYYPNVITSSCFIWDNINGLIDIGTLGGDACNVQDINNNGQVTGSSKTADLDSDGLPITHAFIWDRENGMQDIATIVANSSGAIINDHGAITGTFGRYAHTFLWTQENGMVDLQPNTYGMLPKGMNNQGKIVGIEYFYSSTGTGESGFYWEVESGVNYIFGGNNTTYLNNMNSQGVILFHNSQFSYLVNQDGIVEQLDIDFYVSKISDSGAIVDASGSDCFIFDIPSGLTSNVSVDASYWITPVSI